VLLPAQHQQRPPTHAREAKPCLFKKPNQFGQKVKVPLYARAGIPETWRVNLRGGRVKTYADPAEGAYQTITSYARGEELQSRSLAALRVSVADVLG